MSTQSDADELSKLIEDWTRRRKIVDELVARINRSIEKVLI